MTNQTIDYHGDQVSGIASSMGARGSLKERSIRYVWLITALVGIVALFFIFVFLLKDGFPIFLDIPVTEFLFGTSWNPTSVNPGYGTMPLWVGTILVTIGAILIAAPLGIASAIFISEMASYRVRSIVKPVVELLAGIPSVVYGFFGLIVLTDFLRVFFNIPSGECWLAGSILLAVMALPTIVSVAEDAINAVPKEYREGSFGLGANKWQTISKIVLPAAISGITAAIILGIGRAVGETMAVMMVTGNAAIIPDPIYNMLSPVRTLTGTLGIEIGEVAVGSTHYHALFGVALLLLLITLFINLFAIYIMNKLKSRQSGGGKTSRFFQWNLRDLWEKKTIRHILLLAVFIVMVLIFGIVISCIICAICGFLWFVDSRLNSQQKEKTAFILIIAALLVVFFALAVILYDIIINGLPAINWEFLTGSPKDLGREGGIFPAIIGTLYLVGGAIMIALPIGIGSAIYLIEYTKENLLTKIIRTGVDLLNGTPSIVFGLFGFTFLVLYLDYGVCMLAGQITLALMILPTIIRTTEEALRSVPDSLREGSLAMGATKWQTIYRVVLPPAASGILTGAILSIGRAAGETAPIMFTAVVFSQRFLPDSVFDPVMALPYHLFVLSTNVPGSTTNQYGTALVLITLVIGLYLIAIIIRNHFHKHTRW